MELKVRENRMNVKTHMFNGVRYLIDLDSHVDGLCGAPNSKTGDIHVFAKEGTQNQLITIIHESLHASKWMASEKDVDRTSKDIGRLLWRLGFRRAEE